MDLSQLDVARELQRDRERIIADRDRAARQALAPSVAAGRPRTVVAGMQVLARFAGYRARTAH